MRRLAFAALLGLAACTSRTPPPVADMRYHLGEPVRLGGQWVYPREDFGLDQRGVAAILAGRTRLSANGEVLEPRSLVAAHPTLHLPSIVTVTNLENGRALRLRVIERGPDVPGRIVAVSPRAAELLGAGRAFQAHVTVEAAESRAAIQGLPGQATPLAIAAAPTGRVERESLAPPEGARSRPGGPAALPGQRAALPEAAPAPATPLPETIRQSEPQPGRLMVEGPSFFRRDFAVAQAARLGFRAEPMGPPGRQQQWRVVGGPYATLAEADLAFARALATGQQDLRLVVE